MIDAIEKMIRTLPPPRKGANPGVACLIGFLFGGLGLAIYLRTVVDFFFTIAIFCATLVIAPQVATLLGWLGGAIIASLYGYFRVEIGNRQALEPQTQER